MGFNDDDGMHPPPGQKPIISGKRVQHLVKYNHKVTTDANEPKVMLEFTAGDVSRSPADIVVVLDVSSSMEGEKLEETKSAMKFLMTKLHSDDHLSIIEYSVKAKVLYPLCPVTLRSKTELGDLIRGMKAQAYGSRNMACGLRKAVDVLKNREYTEGRFGAIMFISGGIKEIEGINGIRISEAMDLATIEFADVPVYTFGFDDYKDAKVLKEIADGSRGGTYSDVRLDNLSLAIARCLGGLLSVVAHDVTVMTTQTYECFGHNAKIEKTYELGDLYTNECRKVLLEDILLEEGKGEKAIVEFCYKYKFGGEQYNFGPFTLTVSRPEELSPEAKTLLKKEMVRICASLIYKKEVKDEKARYLLAERALMGGPPEVQAEWIRLKISDVIMIQVIENADRGDLESAKHSVVECKKAVRHFGKAVMNDEELLDEMEELSELLELPDSYQNEVRPFAFSLLSSLQRQRHASRGDRTAQFKLFATPLMQQFFQEAVNFGDTNNNLNDL